jgi:ribose transport system permease protein
MKRSTWNQLMARYPFLFALILLIIALVVNYILQPNLFSGEALNNNMRVFLPLLLLSIGQAVVIIGGGIDISVGGIVSIVNTVLATQVGLNGAPEKMWQYSALCLLIGLLAGAINGFFIAYLRLQPIITTYATSFLYAGLAMFILPNPGGGIPTDISAIYRNTTPLGLPLAFFVIPLFLLIWWYIRSTRYGKYLFAVGGKAQAAYETAVPVTQVQFSTYLVSGLMSALAGIAITMLTGSGNSEIGGPMTLNSITAVVIGGTAMSGGIGGVAGPMIGAVTLGLIMNIISFAEIDTWWQTFVNASIIVIALATPGVINLLQRRKK